MTIVITDATTEPITLQEAKDHCRITVENAAQDALIEAYITAARVYLEKQTGWTVHEKTLEEHLDCWPADGGPIILRGATPLIAIVSFKYVDKNGTESTWASSNYVADTFSKLGRVHPAWGVAYPSFDPYPVSPIRIRFRAGIEVASPITEAPEKIKYPMRLLVRGMFVNRESENISTDDIIKVSMNYGVETFLSILKGEAEDHAF